MIGKDSLLKTLGSTVLCIALGGLCALAPHPQPLMKSFFALSSLLFLGGAALALPSLRKSTLYWGMFALWSTMQAFILFAWVVSIPFITLLAWAITPLTYTLLASLIVIALHKSLMLSPRQRMLIIMSLFLGGMHLMLGETNALKSVIAYFVALVVFPVNLYELFHEPSEVISHLGHTVSTTLLGFSCTFYLLDIIGTIAVSVDGFDYFSMFSLFEGTITSTKQGASLNLVTTTLTYAGVLSGIILLIYLALAVLPRACCERQAHEDIF